MEFLVNKKRLATIGLLCAFAFSALMLASCGNSENNNEAVNAEGEQKTFTIGMDDAYPPYGFRNDAGEITGFDVDLAKEVAKRNGWDFKAETIDWDAKDQMIDSGSISCIWNGFTQEGREENYTFSEPYMLNKQVLVVKVDSGINDIAGLAGKNVETQVDSAALEVLKGDQKEIGDSFKELAEIPEYNTAFMDLESGACDAVACDLSIAQYQMAAKPDMFKMLDPALSEEHYAVACKKGNTELADTITKTLKEMYEDGTVTEISKKYEEYGLSMENWLIK